MRRKTLVLFGLLISASIFVVGPAQAGMVWGVEVFGGWNSFAMSDFNDSLASVNQALGTSFPDIKSGASGGLALRLWPTEQLLLRAVLEGILAETDDSGVKFDVGPGAFTVSGTYFFPSETKVRFGLGAGVGSYTVAGKIEGPGGKLDTGGNGVGVQGMGEIMIPFTERVSLSGMLGYRHAKVSDLTFDKMRTNTEVDYSGAIVRVGFAYDWRPRH